MSDRKLLKKVRDGDKEALSDIIKQYYADIFRFCLYMIQNEEDSYDITQETFLKFMKYGTSYQRNNLKGYLLTIARNCCFDYQQRKKEAGKNLRSYEAENENGSLKISENTKNIQQYPDICGTDKMKELEATGDVSARLAFKEEFKAAPFSLVWDYYCAQQNAGVSLDWLEEVKAYESEILKVRS